MGVNPDMNPGSVSPVRSCVVHGTGLIGASIGHALRSVGWHVAGWDPDPEARAVAHERGAIAEVLTGPDAGLEADLVVLAGPLPAILETLPTLSTDALVVDVAGVKSVVVEHAPSDLRFVGTHPMAGREHAGPAAASGALFQGASWVITTDRARRGDIDDVAGIVGSMGALPVELTARDHDEMVAGVSHLPHLLAVAMMNGIGQDETARQLAAGSFRDITRVAAADPGWWPDVLTANSRHVGDMLDRLIGSLQTVRADLDAGAIDDVRSSLAEAMRRRRNLAPSLERVGVILQDKPGEIAAVGAALERSAVDVRDLTLRHGPHGGGGILALAVRPGEAPALRDALMAEGFELE